MIYTENQELISKAIEEIKNIPEIEEVLSKQEACKIYHLPEDRSGDIVCMSSSHLQLEALKVNTISRSLRAPSISRGLHERSPFYH